MSSGIEPQGIAVGPARDRDFLAIASLDRRAWLDNRHAEFIADGEHVWRLWVDGAHVLVARDGEAVVGAIVAFPTLDGRLCVHKVMVEKSRRGLGIGSRLFEALLAQVDRGDGTECFLTVDPANQAALRLYPRWGFSERRFVPGYYREHEDRYVLTRPAHSPA